jgi:hypothetical protein
MSTRLAVLARAVVAFVVLAAIALAGQAGHRWT